MLSPENGAHATPRGHIVGHVIERDMVKMSKCTRGFQKLVFVNYVRMGLLCNLILPPSIQAHEMEAARAERMIEFSVVSKRDYADPFNDVDLDVVFSNGKNSWRVPAFWRGGQKWTVRFAPPSAGQYAYHLESTDRSNPDLNGHAGLVELKPYSGGSELLKHGMIGVSADGRSFEQADGTPFYWLGDTWWMGLSDRLPWDGFLRLTADRKDKGFTVVQICAGLVPTNEELAPIDPGFSNEGGAVWDPQFKRINPVYFDYADRRIRSLVDSGIAPAIVGGWNRVLPQMGIDKLKKHWRYIIARYSAYPVFWIVGGEIYDPPSKSSLKNVPRLIAAARTAGWSDIARYVRATDPLRHPVSAHEVAFQAGESLQLASLTDFYLSQPSHAGWPSIGYEVAQLSKRYAQAEVMKPFVVGEIGYETIGNSNLQDFQRTAFWLAMLNGAAGFTYGAAPVFEVNNPDKPLHRFAQYTFMTWQEGMDLPGGYQIGLGAKLLRNYEWWRISPHPEWIIPRGTRLVRSIDHDSNAYYLGDPSTAVTPDWSPTEDFMNKPETILPGGEWRAAHGSFRHPYAAGIPGKLRIIYMPYFGLTMPAPPTVLGLEKDTRYHAFYWEPTLGIRFDLGIVELPRPGRLVRMDKMDTKQNSLWLDRGLVKSHQVRGGLIARGETLALANHTEIKDAAVSVDAESQGSAGIVLRYQNNANYIAVMYSSKERSLYIFVRSKGVDGPRLTTVSIPKLGRRVSFSAEIRSNMVAGSISDGEDNRYQTPIIDLNPENVPDFDRINAPMTAGLVGLSHPNDGSSQSFRRFELRESPKIASDLKLSRELYDARGIYRGELSGPRWENYGVDKTILLNSYRPERFPAAQDWVLILEKAQ